MSVSVLFLVHGLVFSSWVSRIPAVQSSLALSSSRLGLALLGIAAGSLISMPASAWAMARWGTGAVAAASSLAFCAALATPGLARDALELGLALGLLGLCGGAMDVSMNAQGVAVEERYGRSLMSSLHALFSIGGMIGSAIGGAVAARAIGPGAHLAAAAVVCLLAILAAVRGLLPHDHHAIEHAPKFRLSPRLVALAVLAFCFFLGEGAVADWSGLYLARVLGAGAGAAALGYSVFSAVMATARLGGDLLINRFGGYALVRAGSVVAAAGIALAVFSSAVPLALAGFALTGAGCAVVVPITFASAGRMRDLPPGTALTAVTTLGYFGLFAGPPSIGFLADALGLRWALLVVAALLGAGVILAASARQPDAAAAEPASMPSR